MAVTKEELFKHYGECTVKKWADLGGCGDDEAICERIECAVVDACCWVEERLGCKVEWDSDNTPATIKRIACSYAAWLLYKPKGLHDENSDRVRKMTLGCAESDVAAILTDVQNVKGTVDVYQPVAGVINAEQSCVPKTCERSCQKAGCGCPKCASRGAKYSR